MKALFFSFKGLLCRALFSDSLCCCLICQPLLFFAAFDAMPPCRCCFRHFDTLILLLTLPLMFRRHAMLFIDAACRFHAAAYRRCWRDAADAAAAATLLADTCYAAYAAAAGYYGAMPSLITLFFMPFSPLFRHYAAVFHFRCRHAKSYFTLLLRLLCCAPCCLLISCHDTPCRHAIRLLRCVAMALMMLLLAICCQRCHIALRSHTLLFSLSLMLRLAAYAMLLRHADMLATCHMLYVVCHIIETRSVTMLMPMFFFSLRYACRRYAIIAAADAMPCYYARYFDTRLLPLRCLYDAVSMLTPRHFALSRAYISHSTIPCHTRYFFLRLMPLQLRCCHATLIAAICRRCLRFFSLFMLAYAAIMPYDADICQRATYAGSATLCHVAMPFRCCFSHTFFAAFMLPLRCCLPPFSLFFFFFRHAAAILLFLFHYFSML